MAYDEIVSGRVRGWLDWKPLSEGIRAHPYIRATAALVALTALLVGAWSLLGTGSELRLGSYIALHSALETCSIVVCVLVYVVARATTRDQRNRNMTLLGVCFLGVALLDFMHTQSYFGMPALITPSSPGKAINFWLAARLLAACALVAIAFLSWERTVPARELRRWTAWMMLGVALVSWVFLYRPQWMPQTFVPGQGLTPFKIWAEYVIIALSCVAAFGFYRLIARPRAEGSAPIAFDPVALLAASAVTAMAEMFFTIYTDVNGIFNVLGHVYKVIGAWFLYRGLVATNLSEVETRAKLALDAAQLGSWSWDINADAIEWDDTAAANWGLPRGSRSPMAAVDALVNADDREAKQAAMRRALDPNGDGDYTADYRIVRADGSVRHVAARGATEFRDGRPVRVVGVVRDVTARRQAEAAVRESEARLSGILSIAADAIITIDAQNRITMFNQGAQRIFGYSSEEAIGAPLDMLLPDRFRAGHAGHIRAFAAARVTARQMGERSEIFGLRKDGSDFPAEASISKLEMAGMIAFTVVLRDISDRVSRERVVRENELRLRLALQAGQVGLFEHDLRTRTLYWSPIYRNILGVAADEPAILERFRALVPAEDLGKLDETMRKARSAVVDSTFELEHRIVRPDGQTRWLLRDVHSHVEGEGADRRVTRIVGAVRDITERKEVEAQLAHRVAERTAELTALLDALPDGIVHAGIDRVIRTNNASMSRLFGYGREELIGMHGSKLYARPSDDSAVETAWVQWETGAAIVPVSVNCRRKDGSTFDAMVMGNVVRDDKDRIVSLVGIIRDVTDEVARTKALQQSQKMETVGQLAGGIAHDFNNLLTVIVGNLELLEPELQTDRQRARVKPVQEAAASGANLTRRLLTVSRQQPLQPEIVKTNALVMRTTELLRRTLGDHIELSQKLAADCWDVHTDPSQIESTLLNLAINARDAMPEGGDLQIETRNVRIDTAQVIGGLQVSPGEYVALAVKDTGTGMAPEVCARVFEPFFTTKEQGRGTGLGLAMIYGFAKQSGGHVTLESEPGKGTTITLFLPRAMAVAAAVKAEVSTTPEADRKGAVILLVEDDNAVRQLNLTRLQHLGYEVIEASTGAQALEMIKGGLRPDLVFSDAVMPGGVSGRELYEQAKAVVPDLKFLLTSGYSQDMVDPEGRLALPVKLLRKPYRLADLAQAVREALSGS